MNKRNKGNGTLIWFVVLVVLLAGYYLMVSAGTQYTEITYADFETRLQEDLIDEVVIEQSGSAPTGTLYISTYISNEAATVILNVPDVTAAQELMESYDFTAYTFEAVEEEGWIAENMPLFVVLAIVIVFFVFLNKQASMSGGGSNMMSFGKSRARMQDGTENRTTFADVAGLQEEKQELEEIVDFLKNPQKYTALGARIPKGVILVGPPGTGKTLLAKAVAGEAGVPFFSISGSDFVEMFVGVGASRVRDLFADAKENAPCIVFIDEIDAVGRRRGTGMGGGHDEREQTLNQLLVEMDGFGVNEGIIVMAATNRVDILDPAIMRAGRFDRKVAVGRPDVQGREEILRVHARKKPLADDVDLKTIAQTTAGFTGADLENLLNEAAILAAGKERPYIIQADIREAFLKVGVGTEKKSRIISEKEKRITAYHESGHAILYHVLPDVGPVYTVSIIPTGAGAAGYTMPLAERDEMFMTRGRMRQEIVVALGGRAAEELVLDDITTGASQDIKQATSLARDMVTKYGFSDEIGLIDYASGDDEVFIGRDLAHTKSYGEEALTRIDIEVRRIMDEAYEAAKDVLEQYREVLDASAALLLEKEKITREEFEALFEDPLQTQSYELSDEEQQADSYGLPVEVEGPQAVREETPEGGGRFADAAGEAPQRPVSDDSGRVRIPDESAGSVSGADNGSGEE